MLPGREHFSISLLIAAIRGTAGSLALNFPSARTCSTLIIGFVLMSALKGRIRGEGAVLAHAPLGLVLLGDCRTRLGSVVFGRGRIVG